MNRHTLLTAVLAALVAVIVCVPACHAQGTPDPYLWLYNPINFTTFGPTMDLYSPSGGYVMSHPVPAPPLVSFGLSSKSQNGTTWVVDPILQTATPFTAAGGAGTVITFPGLTTHAASTVGGVWFLATPMFGAPVPYLEFRADNGQIITSTTAIIPGAAFLRADPNGGVWVFDNTSAQMQNVDVTGQVTPPVTTLSLNTARAAVDRLGQVWIRGITDLHAFSPAGTPLSSVPIPGGAGGVTIDPKGRPRLLVTDASGQSVLTIDPAARTIIGTLSVSATNTYSEFFMDPAGNYWLIDPSGFMTVLDKHGDVINTIAAQGLILETGFDPTGALLAGITPSEDADQDGFFNGQEGKLGSDPFDASSVPPTITLSSPAVSGTSVAAVINAPGWENQPFITGVSLTAAGIPLSNVSSMEIPLTADPLFMFWYSPFNVFASNVAGLLDATGQGALQLTLPAGLPSFTFVMAAMTVDGGTGKPGAISPAQPITVL